MGNNVVFCYYSRFYGGNFFNNRFKRAFNNGKNDCCNYCNYYNIIEVSNNANDTKPQNFLCGANNHCYYGSFFVIAVIIMIGPLVISVIVVFNVHLLKFTYFFKKNIFSILFKPLYKSKYYIMKKK